jgi:hypothetical protein
MSFCGVNAICNSHISIFSVCIGYNYNLYKISLLSLNNNSLRGAYFKVLIDFFFIIV